MRPSRWIALGGLLAGTAVAAGAFGAHGLDGMLVAQYAGWPAKTIAGHTVPASYKYLQDWQTAAQYQVIHALALLAVGLWGRAGRRNRLTDAAGWCFLVGSIVFCGSLYLLVLSGRTWLGAVTPLGACCS